MENKVLIKQFKNKAKKPVAGLTPEHAIYDKNGVRLDAKLGNVNLQEFRNLQQQGVNAIKSQETLSVQAVADREAEILAKSDAAEISSNTEGLEGNTVEEKLTSARRKITKLEGNTDDLEFNVNGIEWLNNYGIDTNGTIVERTGYSVCQHFFPINAQPTAIYDNGQIRQKAYARYYNADKTYNGYEYNTSCMYARFFVGDINTNGSVFTVDGVEYKQGNSIQSQIKSAQESINSLNSSFENHSTHLAQIDNSIANINTSIDNINEQINGVEDTGNLDGAYISGSNINSAPNWFTIWKKVNPNQIVTFEYSSGNTTRGAVYSAQPNLGDNSPIIIGSMVTGDTISIPTERDFYYVAFSVTSLTKPTMQINGESYAIGITKDVEELKESVIALNQNKADKSAVEPLIGLKSHFPKPNYFNLLRDKCPKFVSAIRNKNKDVCVCITGTSLTQGNLYTTERNDGSTRPPLMFAKDLASRIWDKLSEYYPLQQYRRYDHSDLTFNGNFALANSAFHINVPNGASSNGIITIVFNASSYRTYNVNVSAGDANDVICRKIKTTLDAENIPFVTQIFNGDNYVTIVGSRLMYALSVTDNIGIGCSSFALWDDNGDFKNGNVKTTNSLNASVSIVVPADAWQFNYIYRTDKEGANCFITIQEGTGKMEVWNGTSWVEANGYVFSTKETDATSTKGNTCFQKRLKMRCKNKSNGGINSIGEIKHLYIAKGDNYDRMNVWGFEWSPREYMLTIINSARGGHCWGYQNEIGVPSNNNLENTQDSDIWEFNPDLIIAEVTTINWAAGSERAITYDPNWFVNLAKRVYFNEFNDDNNSLYAKSNGYKNCEIVFYGDTISVAGTNANIWNTDGTPKIGVVSAKATNGLDDTSNVGRVKTAIENYDAVENYMLSKNKYIFIPVITQVIKIAKDVYGTYKNAFTSSGADGDTLSIDNTHLNNNGSEMWASFIVPLFDI